MSKEWRIPVPAESINMNNPTDIDPGTKLEPVNGYARLHLPDAIRNIHLLYPLISERRKHADVTAFYSKKKHLTYAQEQELADFNQSAFDAANEHGGLIVYFQGPHLIDVNSQITTPKLKPRLGFQPNCMSFCIWDSLEDAKSGSRSSRHNEASRRAGEWYDRFAIVKYSVSTGDNPFTLIFTKQRRRKN